MIKPTKLLTPLVTPIFVTLTLPLCAFNLQAEQVIWQENFNRPVLEGKGQTGSKVDLQGVSQWSVDTSQATLSNDNDWFKVSNNAFEARDLDGEAIWLSRKIDISHYSAINLSLSVKEVGKHENSDYLDVYYAKDGNDFVKIANWQNLGNDSHTLIGDFSQANISHPIGQGRQLVIKVAMKNSADDERLQIDDISLATVEHSGQEKIATHHLGDCGSAFTKIAAVQGAGKASPLAGQSVVVEGVVTQLAKSHYAFFIQSAANEQDGDKATSEGLFVYLNDKRNFPNIGQRVRLFGSVSEFFERTQLSLEQEFQDCGDGEQIVPTAVSLPFEELPALEALEGMLVTFGQSLSVSDNYHLARYGQFSLSNGRLIKPTNLYRAGSEQAIALAKKNAVNKILVDDLSSKQNPAAVPYPAPMLSAANSLRLGYQVSQLTGVLDFAYNNYQVYPTVAPRFIATNPRQSDFSKQQQGDIRVASFNVLNFFNGDGKGSGFPTARGADSLQEFERQKAKIIDALVQINADVVGLMEIENDGYGQYGAITQLVDALNKKLGAKTYQAVTIPGGKLGTDQITVGMIYKPAKLKTIGIAATNNVSPFDWGNRQPLVQSFERVTSGERFTLAVNHFKSKGSCSRATNANQAQGDGQGCWNQLRTQAANALTAWLATYPTQVVDNDILIVGDLNAYGKEDPINAIVGAGYQDLLARELGESAYTYSYAGELGYLDHALASDQLTEQIAGVAIWHINADEPNAFDYNLEYKTPIQQKSYYAPDAFRSSDHDPVIISFTLTSHH